MSSISCPLIFFPRCLTTRNSISMWATILAFDSPTRWRYALLQHSTTWLNISVWTLSVAVSVALRRFNFFDWTGCSSFDSFVYRFLNSADSAMQMISTIRHKWIRQFWCSGMVLTYQQASGSWCSEITQCFSFQASRGLIAVLFFMNCLTLELTRHYVPTNCQKQLTQWCSIIF